MSYYVVPEAIGQAEIPEGCVGVPTELSPGHPYTAAVCPEMGCGPNSYRGLAKMFADLGYQTPLNASGNPDLRPAWEQFRRDYKFPPATSPSQEAEAPLCAELIRVWSGQGSTRTGTTIRKISSASARKLAAARMLRSTTITGQPTTTEQQAAEPTQEQVEQGFWEARSGIEKGLIIFGVVAVVGGAAFFATRKKP